MKKSYLRNTENSSYKEIAKRVQHEPALIRIGKNGLTNHFEELKKLVKKKKAVKVKILQNSTSNTKLMFQKLRDKTGLQIYRIVGRTAIFIE